MGENPSGINFEGMVGLAFDSHYRMDGSSEDIGFRLKLLEFLKEHSNSSLSPFVASIEEERGGFYAVRGFFSKDPSHDSWFIQFAKEQRQWDPYDCSYFKFNGAIEQTPTGLIVVRNGTVTEYRPASLQGKNLIYAEHNKGRFYEDTFRDLSGTILE